MECVSSSSKKENSFIENNEENNMTYILHGERQTEENLHELL